MAPGTLNEREKGRETEVGPPERDKTEGSQELNDVWVKRFVSASTEYIEKEQNGRNCQSSSCRF
jgi:hypothetical protein